MFNHAAPSDIFNFNYNYPNENGSRKLQSLESEGGPNFIPPAIDFEQTKFGWTIEISNETNEGYCRYLPDAILGPYSKGELMSCVYKLEYLCYRVKTEPPVSKEDACPCFSLEDVAATQASLREIGPSKPIVDVVKSCKEPDENSGLPFGIHFKNSKEAIRRGETHTVSAAVTLYPDVGESQNKCYNGSTSSFLTTGQQKTCLALASYMCESIKTSTPSKACSDDTEYLHVGKKWHSCENKFSPSRNLDPEEQRKICNKFDKTSGKFLFQHCRKSCQSCTCNDDPDFRINGQEDYTCKWLWSLSPEQREPLCQDDDVATRCPTSCYDSCCKDSETFSFKPKTRKYRRKRHGRGTKSSDEKNWMTCNSIGNSNWNELCQSKNVARNCPMTCRRCFIQPRMG
jgi:hypothetical protein